MDINERLARRLHEFREERGLSMEELANRSGVSRAMISRIERAESSPTVTVLNNLSVGLGVLLTELFGPSDYRESRLRLRNPVVSRKGQPEWVDPVMGYRRRTLTPSTANRTLRLTEMHLPRGASVLFEHGPGGAATQQQVWMIRGQLEIRVGHELTVLNPGDCMAITFDHAVTLRNSGDKEARYLVATARSR